jgi:hypothetical protein
MRVYSLDLMTIAKKAFLLLSNPENREQLLDALRFIKNSIIGNPTKKSYYLKQLDIAPK